MAAFLERRFLLADHGTSVTTEVRAGIVTFMTLCYILFVQRAVLGGAPPHGAGMDPDAVVVAACLASALATLVMALAANYPLALAPCMGENFFFVSVAATAVGGWRTALAAVFVSGAVFLLLSAFRFREKIIAAVPESLKYAISVGIGLFIAFIGLQKGGLLASDPFTFVKLGPLHSPVALLTAFGLLVTAGLYVRRVPGAFLWGMLATTGAGLATGMVHFSGFFSLPPSIGPVFLKLDLAGLLSVKMIPVVLIFLFMVLFDTVGTLIGVANQAGLLENGQLPRAGRALLADAVGTTAGAAMGSSTVSAFIESSAGVAEGGRTGLTSVVTALCFLGAMFCTPLVAMVGGGVVQEGTVYLPVIAPVLIVVGSLMAKSVKEIEWSDPTEALPSFLVILGMPLTFNIANGFALGFVSYPLLKLLSGRWREASPLVYVLGVLFLLYFAFLSH
jgi:AGZA family xanthine/uracil permease-like MFS transporter